MIHRSVKCFLSKIYAVYKEQVHLTGYAGLLCILWAIYSHISTFIDTANANTTTVALHTVEIEKLNEWKNNVDIDFADMKREIDDIHDVVMGKK